MLDPLAPLSTNPQDFIFVDVETRSTSDVTVHGAARHTAHARVTIFVYAIGDGPVQEVLLTDWSLGTKLDWADMPQDFLDAYAEVRAGRKWFVAWNAAFEFNAFTRSMRGAEDFKPDYLLDAMVQATRSHLPPDLYGASQVAKVKAQKHADGKRLIKMFADENLHHTPQTDPEDWDKFRAYAVDDVNAMREVWNSTMPLSRQFWREYWVSERINHRGIPMDVPFVEGAAKLAEFASAKANDDISEITGGVVTTVNQAARMIDWLRHKLRMLPEVDRILTREYVEEPTEDGEDVVRLPKYSLERTRVEELIAYLERMDEEEGLTDDEFDALRLLEVRLYGASATPKKFGKALLALDEGHMRGQYVFAGAAATTRFSSRGLQIHNMTRSTIGSRDDELDAIEMVADMVDVGQTYVQLQKRFGPVGRTLSRLIRPAFIAPEGKRFCWADWSGIESRVLPWLADSPKADELLEVFRENDRDPSLPDNYVVTAASILGKPASEVTKQERQSHGKTPVLALGYAGGKGALFNMARIYGVSFTEDEAQEIVYAWRDKNPWAVNYWADVWESVLYCLENPGEARAAGRVTFYYDRDYIGGTLFMVLPDGTWLSYPAIRWEERERKDKMTGKIESRVQLTYRAGRGRMAIHKGVLVNNSVQGTAACLMRAALVRIDAEDVTDVVLHTHDEIACMPPEDRADEVSDYLCDIMRAGPDWADGLPLAVEATIAEFYTKTAEG